MYIGVCVLSSFVGIFVRLSRAVRCHKTLGNAFLSISVLDSDVLPPHTVLGRAVVELALLGPIYLSQPLEILDSSDPKLVRYFGVMFEVAVPRMQKCEV